MTPNHADYQIDYDIREDDRVFNVVQIMFLALTLVAVCCFAARSVGLDWGTTLALSWGCGIFGTLLIAASMFFVHEAVERLKDPALAAEPDTIEALIGEWDDDLASDPLANGTALWFGDRSALRDASDETPMDQPELKSAAG